MILSYRKNQLFYQIMGGGPRWVIAFHGYGETGECFRPLAAELGARFSFICADLPLHGKSVWEDDPGFNPETLAEIVAHLMAAHGISSVILAGYSMGGRLASCLFALNKLSVEELWLFASDGFHRNPWYWFATQVEVGNRLFRYTMNNPGWLLNSMKAASSVRVLNPAIYKFSIRFLQKAPARKALYERWTFYRHFWLDKEILLRNLVVQKAGLRQFYGQYDRIIPPSNGSWMQKNLSRFVQTILLPCGHRLMDPAITPNIAAAIEVALPFHATHSDDVQSR